MWLEHHPYVSIYLLGCGLAASLIIFKLILFKFVAWITKENIQNYNLNKIRPPDEKSLSQKVGLFLGTFIFEVFLSWIYMIVVVWQIFAMLFRVLREALTTVPEEIKALRFPLLNNPQLSPESVWAYAYALGIKAGINWTDEAQMLNTLEEMTNYNSSFNRKTALKQLGSLNVVSDDVISAVLNYTDSCDEDSSWAEAVRGTSWEQISK